MTSIVSTPMTISTSSLSLLASSPPTPPLTPTSWSDSTLAWTAPSSMASSSSSELPPMVPLVLPSRSISARLPLPLVRCGVQTLEGGGECGVEDGDWGGQAPRDARVRAQGSGQKEEEEKEEEVGGGVAVRSGLRCLLQARQGPYLPHSKGYHRQQPTLPLFSLC